VIASLSGLLDWLTGPSSGLLRIGREWGYLPRYFQRLNPNVVQLRILVCEGAAITLIGLLYALVPTVSRAHWVFAALATEVYLIMYVLMFVAAVRLRRREGDHERGTEPLRSLSSASWERSPPSRPVSSACCRPASLDT
jgi:glutamate:GABA antiporter